MLGPFGVRFVIAEEGDLPPGVAERLTEQLDLDRLPAGGLTIFRNAAALPTAFVSANAPVPDRADPAAVEASPAVIASAARRRRRDLHGDRGCPGHRRGRPAVRAGWRVENGGEVLAPFAGYGWAIAAPVQAGTVDVHFTDQWLRTVELYLLALLWIVALWVTRKPGSA